LDDRQDSRVDTSTPRVAYLAPPTDREYPGAIQRVFDRHAPERPSVDRFRPHRDELPDHVTYDLIVLTGSVARIGTPEPWFSSLADYLERAIDAGTPVMGVCFGHQFLADLFGGTVSPLPDQQVSVSTIERADEGRAHPLFEGLPDRFESFVYHHDHVTELPTNATRLARNETGIQAFALDDRPVWGLQFHPEFTEPMARAVGYDGPLDVETSRRLYPNALELARRQGAAPTAVDH
jgi:GMP synthase (glutamine-hydrolysing)